MWKDITIRTYQELYPVLTRPFPEIEGESKEKRYFRYLEFELDQQIDCLIIIDGRTREHYESLTQKAFKLLLGHYAFIFTPPVAGKHPRTFKVKGIRYWVDYNPANIQSRLTGKDIIDLTTIANEEGVIVSNMNRILASYIVPGKRLGLFKREIDLEEALLDLDMQTAFDITAFFLPLLDACLKGIQDYLLEELVKQKEIVSTHIGDGKLPSTT